MATDPFGTSSFGGTARTPKLSIKAPRARAVRTTMPRAKVMKIKAPKIGGLRGFASSKRFGAKAMSRIPRTPKY